jgi:hypothetical protein
MTTDASAGLTRYDIYMHSDEIQFLRACPDGDYVKHAEADALLADLRGKLAEKDARIAQLEAELAAATKDAERYRWLRSRSTYRYDCGQFVLDFDNWIEVTDVDDPDGGESRPTPPSRFDAAIDAATKPAAPTVDDSTAHNQS